MNYYNVTLDKKHQTVTARDLGGCNDISSEDEENVGVIQDPGIEDGWLSVIVQSFSASEAVEDAVLRFVEYREANP